MLLLLIILAFAYKFQFQMQVTVSTYDNFEQFDCQLFHQSIAKTEDLVSSGALSEDALKSEDAVPDHKNPHDSTIIPHYTRVRYQREAYATWRNFYKPKDGSTDNLRSYINGTLSCFCEDRYD